MATNTAASFTNHTGNGTAGPFSISFSYLAESEVDVTVGGVSKTITTHYTFTSATQITFTSGNEPGNGVAIKFQRDTDISAKKVDFEDGSVLTEADLDTQNDQVLFAQQEILDKLSGIEENATADQTDAEIRTAVENATDSNVFTDADHSKLNAIEASATADQTASEIRTLVENASDSNVFTDADHTKLNAIEDNATADQTNSEIKTAYEANSDTNAFTDAEKTKLSGIATGAEVNVQSDFNATSGDAVILNKPTIPSALNDLSDVNTTGAADGKILKFQSSSNTFIIADDANDGGGGGGGSLTDGDKGDITVSSSGASWSIDASAVSTNKIADDAVTQAKIANDAVTRDKINSISTSSLPSFEAKGDGSSQDGYIQLNCSQNSHGVKIKSPPHSANASYTLTLPNNDGSSGQFLKTDGSGVLSFDTVDLSAKMNKAGDTITGDVTIASGTTNKNINIDVDSKIRFDDDLKATFGNGDDLQIYHDGSHSYIDDNGTGNLKIQLGGATKAEVVSTGLTVTGTLTATAYAGDGSGLTGIASTVAGGAIYENSATISASHTIASGTNGMSAGPVSVSSGITLTISSGSVYTVV